MTRPIDTVLGRLEGFKLRQNGADRWRACCPAHEGKNETALSIGIGTDDAVLIKCFHGCSTDAVVAALGLELHDLFPPRPAAGGGASPIKRRRLLTAGQALDLLHDETHLVVVMAADMARGVIPDELSRQRLLQSAARLLMLREEVRA